MGKSVFINIPNKEKFKEISIYELKELQGNLKDFSKEAYEKLKNRILEVGFKYPFYVWKDDQENCYYYIDGHHRAKTLLKMKDEGIMIPEFYPVIEIEAKNKKDAATELLHLNSNYGKMTQNGLSDYIKGFNIEKIEIKNVNIQPINVNLDKVKDEENKTKNDDELEESINTITKNGDLIQLNNNVILCGDSSILENVNLLFGNKKINMIFTDPPYGVSYNEKNIFLNNFDEGNRIQKEIENDNINLNDLFDNIIIPSFLNIVQYMDDEAVFYICFASGAQLAEIFINKFNKVNLKLSQILIWNKNNHVLGRSDYNYKHEIIYYGWNKKHKFYGNGDHKFSVWNFDKPIKNDLHPTMKPVELIVNAIKNSSLEEHIISDPFLGSGSTLIACEKTNRICYGIEKEFVYCDVIIYRWIKWMIDNNKEIKQIKINKENIDYRELIKIKEENEKKQRINKDDE